MKKIIFLSLAFITSIQISLAQEAPGIWGQWLPWDVNNESWLSWNYDNSPFERFANNFASEFIKFVAAVAVISLMISGIMLIISGGQEEKFKTAKTWFIWSLEFPIYIMTQLKSNWSKWGINY